ncbi:MAG: NAD-dependent epimerase/dehydratase family protein [Xanthobacteraceae bacterium]
MPIKAIITGATGMVGEAVLLECLDNPAVGEVLAINRKPSGRAHPKLSELIHADFFDPAPLAGAAAGYDACFFCLGVSSVGMDAGEYRRMTYDLTLGFAQALAKASPDMTFCYITGKGTDSSEQGRIAWARVKGETENALMRLFPNAYMFRPGMMRATPGQKNLPALYRYLGWIYPIGRALFPASFCTLQELARAMINAASKGYERRVLEVNDIVKLAKG